MRKKKVVTETLVRALEAKVPAFWDALTRESRMYWFDAAGCKEAYSCATWCSMVELVPATAEQVKRAIVAQWLHQL